MILNQRNHLKNKSRAQLNSLSLFLKVFEILMFVLLVLVNLLPFIWGAITSLKSSREVLSFPPKLWGFKLSTEHYARVFADTFFVGIRNSLMYAIFAIVIGVVVGMMAAYALRRLRFRGKRVIFILILSCIPLSSGSAALVVPNYTFFTKLGMINTWYILPLIYLGYNLPMAIWVLMSGMEMVPVELDEAAKMDGAGRWYILFRIIFPVMLPSIASAALFIFLGAWNEYVVSSVLVSRSSLYPIQVSIYNYMGYYGVEWGPLTAAATAAVIPTIIVFAMLGRMMISGLTAGAVKD
jgi:ABC-type glycerol-3-phosphate transport system permease component